MNNDVDIEKYFISKDKLMEMKLAEMSLRATRAETEIANRNLMEADTHMKTLQKSLVDEISMDGVYEIVSSVNPTTGEVSRQKIW